MKYIFLFFVDCAKIFCVIFTSKEIKIFPVTFASIHYFITFHNILISFLSILHSKMLCVFCNEMHNKRSSLKNQRQHWLKITGILCYAYAGFADKQESLGQSVWYGFYIDTSYVQSSKGSHVLVIVVWKILKNLLFLKSVILC